MNEPRDEKQRESGMIDASQYLGPNPDGSVRRASISMSYTASPAQLEQLRQHAEIFRQTAGT